MNERIEAVVSGRVQMVMYRDFATRTARSIGITGTVRNLPDGTVRVIAEGPSDRLQSYIRKLEKGSFFAEVRNVSIVRKPATGEFADFSIAYG